MAFQIPYKFQYVAIAASQTKTVLSGAGTGAKGDYLHLLICSVNTVASATVTLYDGTGGGTVTIPIITAASALLGPVSLEINLQSLVGPWQVTTGAGATVLAVGIFSP